MAFSGTRAQVTLRNLGKSMSLGSIVLRLHQKFGHGLRVAYWRDVVRPRILRSRPVPDTTDEALPGRSDETAL